MSMPYYVHKDDANKYDELKKRTKPLEENIKELEKYYYTNKNMFTNKNIWIEIEKLCKPINDQIVNITNEYKPIRIKSMMDKIKIKDYYVYFLGRRLDDDFAIKMSGVAKNGIKKMKKVLK